MAFPLIAAGALLAPLVGGAMSLAGGALSLTGGLTHAASTAAGMAWDVGKGVAGAAGGMLGGGKSGNKVEQVADKKGKMHDVTSSTGKAVIAGKKYQEQKARVQAGKDLGVKTFTPPTAGDGEKSESSLLSQILSITTINSGFLANISTGMDSLVAGALSQSATEKRESGLEGAETDPKGPGAISRGLSKTWGGIKKTLGSVSSGLSMAMKAIGLGAVFFLMKKYRTNIKEWMANIFETFDFWYHEVKESESPFKTAWEGIKTMTRDSYNWLVEKSKEFVGWLWNTIKLLLNEHLGTWFDTDKDVNIRAAAAGMPATDTALSGLKVGGKTGQDLGTITTAAMDKIRTQGEGTEGERNQINADVFEKLQKMYTISENSGFRIQWTDIPFRMQPGFYTTMNAALSAHGYQLPIAPILAAQPILDDKTISMADLSHSSFSLDKSAGISASLNEDSAEKIRKNLRSIAYYKRLILSGDTGKAGITLPDWLGGGTILDSDYQTEIDELMKENVSLGQNKELIQAHTKALTEVMPDKTKLDEMADKANTIGSIFTHDTHMEELLKPISKAFAEGKQSPPVVMAPDNRNQSVTKLGDTYSGGLSSRVQDSTARMLAYTKNLNSTTGQFA